MEDLHQFKDDVSGQKDETKPPYTLRASDLDNNFALCYPMKIDGFDSAYSVDRDGSKNWKLVGNKVFTVCENGRPVDYRFFAEVVQQSGN